MNAAIGSPKKAINRAHGEEARAASDQRRQHEAAEVQPKHAGRDGEDLIGYWCERGDKDRPHVVALVLLLDKF